MINNIEDAKRLYNNKQENNGEYLYQCEAIGILVEKAIYQNLKSFKKLFTFLF